MNSIEIQKEINKTNYIDARVTKMECNYFADEVNISFDNDEKETNIIFTGCYEVNFKHIKEYAKEKPIKNYTIQQIPYFLQNIDVKEKDDYYTIKINMYPLYVDIQCKDISIF